MDTYVSNGNSTTSELGSGETFTGKGEQAKADGVTVSCQTDNSGTLFFDFSIDGTNWGAFPSNGFKVAAGIHEYHTAKVNGRFFRVRLVNDSGAQTYLRLRTYFGVHTHPSAPLNQTLGFDADAQVVRSIDPTVDLALGRLGGVQSGAKFGYSRGLGTAIQIDNTATWVDLWSYGGQRTSPTSTFTPYMASASGSDTNVDVTWEYLDANGVKQSVEANTDGQTPVSLGVTAQEVTRGYVSGTTAPVGDIACATTNDFTSGVPTNQNEVLAAFFAEDAQTQLLADRVPANKKLIINRAFFSCTRASGAAGSVVAAIEVRENQTAVWRNRYPLEFSTTASINDELLLVLDAGADYRVRVRDVSDTNTAIRGVLDTLLVDV